MITRIQLTTQFRARGRIDAGNLLPGEVRSIVHEVELDINAQWKKQARKIEAMVTYDQFQHKVTVDVFTTRFLDEIPADWDKFQETENVLAKEALNEIIETLELAKRVKLIEYGFAHPRGEDE